MFVENVREAEKSKDKKKIKVWNKRSVVAF